MKNCLNQFQKKQILQNHFRQKSINNTKEFDLSNFPDYKNIRTRGIKDDNNFDSSQKNNKSLIYIKVKHSIFYIKNRNYSLTNHEWN